MKRTSEARQLRRRAEEGDALGTGLAHPEQASLAVHQQHGAVLEQRLHLHPRLRRGCRHAGAGDERGQQEAPRESRVDSFGSATGRRSRDLRATPSRKGTGAGEFRRASLSAIGSSLRRGGRRRGMETYRMGLP